MMKVAIGLAALALTLTACSGEAPKASAPTPTPSPSVTPDAWAIKMCDYLGGQDPGNEYSTGFAVIMASKSTLPEVVDLGVKAKQAGDTNLLRGWCTKHYPQAGATPGLPVE